MAWVAFGIGLLLGVSLGILIGGLCAMAKHGAASPDQVEE